MAICLTHNQEYDEHNQGFCYQCREKVKTDFMFFDNHIEEAAEVWIDSYYSTVKGQKKVVMGNYLTVKGIGKWR